MKQKSRPEKCRISELSQMHCGFGQMPQLISELSNRNMVAGQNIPYLASHVIRGVHLSNCFVCECCGNKMYQDGRNEGGFRCSKLSACSDCWNKASALRDFTYQQIGRAICDAIMPFTEMVDPIVDFVTASYSNDDQRRRARKPAAGRRTSTPPTANTVATVGEGKGRCSNFPR